MTTEEFIDSIKLDGEEWKDVVGYEGYYMVSNFGRIISCARYVPKNNGIRRITTKLLAQNVNHAGYCKTILCKNSKSHKHELVHRIVAKAFIPNPYNKPMIDHKDRDKTNNHVSNLMWCTIQENMQNPNTIMHCRNLNLNRIYPTLRHPVVALRNNIVIKQYNSIKEAAVDGHKSCGISNCCAKRTPTYHGYKWMYLEDYNTLINKSKNSQSISD